MEVSIIIVVYNQEKYIGRALRSCLDQAFPRTDYEIIVVNDGSTDRTLEVIKPFKDFYMGLPPFVKVIDLKKNMGIGYASNEGIKKSLGQFIVRVDSDDYIHPKMLEIESLFLQMNKDMDAVACDYLVVDEFENILGRENSSDRWSPGGTMFRKDRLTEIGLYDPEFKLLEDEDLKIRFLEKYYIHRIRLPLYRCCKHKGQNTADEGRMEYYMEKLKDKHKFLRNTAVR